MSGNLSGGKMPVRYLTCEEQARRHAILAHFGVWEQGDNR